MDTSPTPPPEPAPEPAPEPPPKKHPQGRKPAEQKKTAPPPSEPPLEEQRETASMTKSFMVAKTNFPTEFHAALKQLGLTEPVAPGSYIKVLDVINRILDENM
jgi:outer membrane biosynthesis protein TonB